MKKVIITLLAAILHVYCNAQITIDYCLEKAEHNYPLINRYSLVEKTKNIQLSDINKSWLPRIGLYAQTTVQNIVPEFPEALENALAQMGQETKGLGHIQYKTGIDLSQTVWDGGAAKAQRNIQRASSMESEASIAVQMYAMKEKVMNLFFGILLMDEQIAQTENTVTLLQANHNLMTSMFSNGVATQSDVDMIEAQILTLSQQLTEANNALESYRNMLALYIGESLDGKTLVKPNADMPSDYKSARPEISLFDARLRLNRAKEESVSVSVMPKIGLFAQAYYGYPGFNYFESMMKRDLSFNFLAGVKVSWNIDAFYTKKNSRKNLAIASEIIENDREVFLFNTQLQTKSQTNAITGLKKVIADDSKIINLRQNVRHAAESQLRNGVIDATALLSKITDENQARLAARYHEIQLIQNIYQLKYTLNR